MIILYTAEKLRTMSNEDIHNYRLALAETVRFMPEEMREPYLPEFPIIEAIQVERRRVKDQGEQ
jgi:hypothetical protein